MLGKGRLRKVRLGKVRLGKVLSVSFDPSGCTHLLLIPHGALSSDHNFTARLLFQLLRCHSSGSQNPSDKIELKQVN